MILRNTLVLTIQLQAGNGDILWQVTGTCMQAEHRHESE
jgi:hypothetical protein